MSETNTTENRIIAKCAEVRTNDDGSIVYRGTVKGKLDGRDVQQDADFVYCPSLTIAIAHHGEEEALKLLNRQSKTDSYNDVRNGMLAKSTPQGEVRRALKALSDGTASKAETRSKVLAALAEMGIDPNYLDD